MREREEIRVGLERHESFTSIAQSLGRSVSSLSREVASNGGRKRYEAWRAHGRAYARARRPKPTRLSHKPLAAKVIEGLEQWWSPEEIVRRLRAEFLHDPMMLVSHVTIYKTLYIQGRGELRRELHRCLRTGRAKRRPQDRMESRRGKIPNMVMISERPAEAEDRATRFVILLHLPDDKEVEKVDAAMRKAILSLPEVLRRSNTWDRGGEMSRHQAFTIHTGVQIYFCDPHSPWQQPWQRGSNENTNGLLRQYMPKGTDLSVHSAADLQRFAASINNRPRKALGNMKPSEKLAEFLALTG